MRIGADKTNEVEKRWEPGRRYGGGQRPGAVTTMKAPQFPRLRVRPPAAGLSPHAFGFDRNAYSLFGNGGLAAITEAALGVTAIFTSMPLAPYLIVLFVFAPLLVIPVISRAWWVAGGNGWLMLMWGRRPQAWVHTRRLTSVQWLFGDLGVNGWISLTLRDDEGREMMVPLRHLSRRAAAELLAGIRQSAGNGLDGTAAPVPDVVTALDGRANCRRVPASIKRRWSVAG